MLKMRFFYLDTHRNFGLLRSPPKPGVTRKEDECMRADNTDLCLYKTVTQNKRVWYRHKLASELVP